MFNICIHVHDNNIIEVVQMSLLDTIQTPGQIPLFYPFNCWTSHGGSNICQFFILWYDMTRRLANPWTIRPQRRFYGRS